MTKEELEAFLRSHGVAAVPQPMTPEQARRPGIRCGKCDGADVPEHWITCSKRTGLS
jgi:hypothetical protein